MNVEQLYEKLKIVVKKGQGYKDVKINGHCLSDINESLNNVNLLTEETYIDFENPPGLFQC